MIYYGENPVPSCGQAQKCGEVKPVTGSQISPLDNWISNGNPLITI